MKSNQENQMLDEAKKITKNLLLLKDCLDKKNNGQVEEQELPLDQLYESWQKSEDILAQSKQLVDDLNRKKIYFNSKISEADETIRLKLAELKQLLSRTTKVADQKTIDSLQAEITKLKTIKIALRGEIDTIGSELAQAEALYKSMEQTHASIKQHPQLQKFLIQNTPLVEKIQKLTDPMNALLATLKGNEPETLRVDLSDFVVNKEMLQKVDKLDEINTAAIDSYSKLLSEKAEIILEMKKIDSELEKQSVDGSMSVDQFVSGMVDSKLKERRADLVVLLEATQQAMKAEVSQEVETVANFKQQLMQIKDKFKEITLDLENPKVSVASKVKLINQLEVFKSQLDQMRLSGDVFTDYVRQIDSFSLEVAIQVKQSIQDIESNLDSNQAQLKDLYEKSMPLMHSSKTTSSDKKEIEKQIKELRDKISADLDLLSNKDYIVKIEIDGGIDKLRSRVENNFMEANWLASFIFKAKLSESEKIMADSKKVLENIATPSISFAESHDAKVDYSSNDRKYSYTFVPPENEKDSWRIFKGKNDGSGPKVLGNIDRPELKKEPKSSRFKIRRKKTSPIHQPESKNEISITDKMASIIYRSNNSMLNESGKTELSRLVQAEHLKNESVQRELNNIRESQLKSEINSVTSKLNWVIIQLADIEEKQKNTGILFTNFDKQRKQILEKQQNYLENCFIQLNNPKVNQTEKARFLSHEDLLKTANPVPTIKKSLSSRFFNTFSRKRKAAELGSNSSKKDRNVEGYKRMKK